MAVLYLHFLLHIDWNIKEIKMDLYSVLLGKKFCTIIFAYCPLRQKDKHSEGFKFLCWFYSITVKYLKSLTEKKSNVLSDCFILSHISEIFNL